MKNSLRKTFILVLAIIFVATVAGCGGGSKHDPNQTNPAVDQSPHQQKCLTANGVKLHYLDWGGNGETILFLAGLGDTAHIFDDLAPKFSKQYRVLALTRRGFGQSDQPTDGFDVDLLVNDIVTFLDTLGIQQVTLVGHSIAGNELTRMAATHPERVKRLIYLDAGWNYDGTNQTDQPINADVTADPLAEPTPTFADAANYGAAKRFYQKISAVWTPAWENNFVQTLVFCSDGTIEYKTPESVVAVFREQAYSYNAEYDKISVPTLFVIALPESVKLEFPWLLDNIDSKTLALANADIEQQRVAKREFIGSIVSLVKGAQVATIDAIHYNFIEYPDRVSGLMNQFLNKN